MQADPEVRPTRLADGRVDPPVFVPAAIIRRFQPTRLADVEAVWTPARAELTAAREAAGQSLESSHWNWAGKAERVEAGVLFLVALECEGDVQGLMALPLQPRPATLTPGERLVYVDYLEAAPWNQRSPVPPAAISRCGSRVDRASHPNEPRAWFGWSRGVAFAPTSGELLSNDVSNDADWNGPALPRPCVFRVH